jgi:hypothetical protein
MSACSSLASTAAVVLEGGDDGRRAGQRAHGHSTRAEPRDEAHHGAADRLHIAGGSSPLVQQDDDGIVGNIDGNDLALAPVFTDCEVVRAKIVQRAILRVGHSGQHDAAGRRPHLRLAGRGQRRGDAYGDGDGGSDHGIG